MTIFDLIDKYPSDCFGLMFIGIVAVTIVLCNFAGAIGRIK